MKMIRLLCRTLPFILIALAMADSATGAKKSSGGQYTSPLGNFSLPVPICDPPMWEARPCSGGDQGGGDFIFNVSFHDDFGTLWAITYLRLSPDIQKMLDDPIRRDTTFISFLHEIILPDVYRSVIPDARVLHEEFLNADGQRELLVVVDLPEGSTLTVMQSGKNGWTSKRLDSTRALLIFKKGEFMYVLTHELRTMSNRKSFLFDDKMLEPERDSLHRFKETIEFNVTLPEKGG